MAARYGVGIIGAGWVAGEYIKAFRDHPLADVIGIHSRTPGKAAHLLRTHGVEGQEYASLDDLLRDDRVAIVVSATHADVRADHVERIAAAGRHVVIEKPAGLTLQQTARIRAAVARAGVKSVVSFVLRWNPQFETVRQLIRDGGVGNLVYAEGDYWHPLKNIGPGYGNYMRTSIVGSAFVAGGCHAVDMVRFLGGEIDEVAAFGAAPKLNFDFEYQPVVVASLRFKNGAVGKLSTLLEGDTPYIFNCRLFGTAGTIQNNAVYSSRRYPGSLGYWEFPTVKPDNADVTHHPFAGQIAHFVDCIERDVESHCSIQDAYKSMAVCFAIDESAAKGGQPVLVQNE